MHENQNKSLVKLLLDVILTSIIDLCAYFSSFFVGLRLILVLLYYSSVIFDIEDGTLLFLTWKLLDGFLPILLYFHVVFVVVVDVVLIWFPMIIEALRSEWRAFHLNRIVSTYVYDTYTHKHMLLHSNEVKNQQQQKARNNPTLHSMIKWFRKLGCDGVIIFYWNPPVEPEHP